MKQNIIKQALEEFEVYKNLLSETADQVYGDVAKQQIKEALEDEDDFSEEDVNTEIDVDAEEASADVDTADVADEIDSDEAEDISIDTEETPEGEIADIDIDAELDDIDFEGDAEVVDLTGASDDEVIKVFKKMSDSDEIEIVDDEVTISDPESGNEYKIELPETKEEEPIVEPETEETDDVLDLDAFGTEDEIETPAEEDAEDSVEDDESFDLDLDIDSDGDEKEDDTEIVFEVELDENKVIVDDCEEVLTDEQLDEQIPVGMAQATHKPAEPAIEAGIVGAGAQHMLKLQESVSSLETENAILKETINSLKLENERQHNALLMFKENIVETKVQTKKLASMTKLFLEHSTTKQEKENIVKSLNKAKTIEESEAIEKQLIAGLIKRGTIEESIDKSINTSLNTSTSKAVINESTYVDPKMAQVDRMKTLMFK